MQDYSYLIVFFVIFTVFVFFAIRPNILTAFDLQKELQDLRLKNNESEAVILQIVNYQSILENYRDKLVLLDEAVPSSPGLAKAVEDVRILATNLNLEIAAMNVDSIEFSDQKGSGEIHIFNINLTSTGTSSQVSEFMTALLNQRRLKSPESLDMSTDSDGRIKVNLIIKTYYL